MAAPLLAAGGGIAFWNEKTDNLVSRFENSRTAAAVLTFVAWFWAGYEMWTMGIDVFDKMLKIFPGQIWLMAALLGYLTFIWMPDHLSVRALTGILMLFPAALFRTTRLLVPAGGFAAVHILVATGYAAAICGMYGMFYPWRLEKAYALVSARPKWRRSVGCVLIAWGAAVMVAGVLA